MQRETHLSNKYLRHRIVSSVVRERVAVVPLTEIEGVTETLSKPLRESLVV